MIIAIMYTGNMLEQIKKLEVRALLILLVVLSILCSQSCFSLQTDNQGLALKEKIESFVKNIVNEYSLSERQYIEPYMYEENPDFINIFNNPCLYHQDAKALLDYGSLSQREENILSKMLYMLPADSYLVWMDRVYDAYRRGNVTIELLNGVLFPRLHPWPIYLSSQNQEVVNFYKRFVESPDLTDFQKKSAERIISGKTLAWIENYQKETNLEVNLDKGHDCNR